MPLLVASGPSRFALRMSPQYVYLLVLPSFICKHYLSALSIQSILSLSLQRRRPSRIDLSGAVVCDIVCGVIIVDNGVVELALLYLHSTSSLERTLPRRLRFATFKNTVCKRKPDRRSQTFDLTWESHVRRSLLHTLKKHVKVLFTRRICVVLFNDAAGVAFFGFAGTGQFMHPHVDVTGRF